MANPIKAFKVVKRTTRQKFGYPKVEKPIKISKAEAKANARGLKAANKPVSKNNRGQTASQLKTDILKNAKPARPNRVRGGSMKSKLNFPKGMK